MERDKLNEEKKYQEIINDTLSSIDRFSQKIIMLNEDEKNKIQKYPRPNLEIIKAAKEDILNYQFRILKAMYSKGEDVDSVKKIYLQLQPSMHEVWRKSNGYAEMVWMLSIGIMLNISDEEFGKLKALVEKDNPNDFLIDFLIQSRSSWSQQSVTLMFPRPYQATKEICELAQTSKEKALERLQKYLQKEWYKGHSDSGWHDAHKSKWNIHSGYWSFESGALVKILSLDDSSLKNQQYYPYDMVHWKD